MPVFLFFFLGILLLVATRTGEGSHCACNGMGGIALPPGLFVDADWLAALELAGGWTDIAGGEAPFSLEVVTRRRGVLFFCDGSRLEV